MPQRNAYKEYVEDSYYHIYNRGVNKADIFADKEDFTVFLGLLKRYLGEDCIRKPNREFYANYYNDIELLSYCLMPNHFHLFIFQNKPMAIKELMKSLGVSYAMYFNKKYKRTGPVFQQRYKAVLIKSNEQLLHITRYIHMNPQDYKTYEWSSLPYYTYQRRASWLRPAKALELFEGENYQKFLDEYEQRRNELKEFKGLLADA